jgi:hypothetical protein
MEGKDRPPHLRAVPPKPDKATSAPRQGTLFPEPRPSLLTVVDVSSVGASEFFEALDGIRPRLIFDLRPVPSFEQWGIARSQVFSRLRDCGCTYHDIAGTLGIESSREAGVGSGSVATEISARYLQSSRAPSGPIFILVGSSDLMNVSARVFPTYLRPAPIDGWEVETLSASKRGL